MHHVLYISVFTISSLLYTAYALSCYKCRSDVHDGCGETFTASKTQMADYEVDCSLTGSKPIACKKIISNERNKKLVVRSCMYAYPNSSFVPDFDDKKKSCIKMTNSQTCYCKNKGKPCNGQSRAVQSFIFIFTTAILAMILRQQ